MGVRSCLAVGAATVAAAAVVVAPPAPVRPVHQTQPVTVTRIDLAAAASPLVVTPPDRDALATARDAIIRLDPTAAAALAAPPTTQNAASDFIVSTYQAIQFWVDYGVELTQYVLQFIPYGYLIGDQVGIVYYNLVRPISDSVVYDFIVPVVNDPLNIWTYINGGIAVGSTTITALINTGIAEFNYFFGWLIPPLPPIPFAVESTVEETPDDVTDDVVTMTASAEEESDPALLKQAPEALPEAPKVIDEPGDEAAELTEVGTDTDLGDVEALEVEAEVKVPTVDSLNGVSAQGEVRTGGQTVTPGTTPDPTDPKSGDVEPTPPTTPEPTTTEPPADPPSTPDATETGATETGSGEAAG